MYAKPISWSLIGSRTIGRTLVKGNSNLRVRPLQRQLSTVEDVSRPPPSSAREDVEIPKDMRLPRAIQALHLKPLRRVAEYGIPSCDLQLRSYSFRNLEFFADFAIRAAYYLGLPAYGPIPLPRITERWTVPRSTFIFKKSQENWERVTARRLIQIRDGNVESVQAWLAFLQKHQYYGIGMKANVWEFGKLVPGVSLDHLDNVSSALIDSTLEHLGQHSHMPMERVEELMVSRRYKSLEPRTRSLSLPELP